MSIFGSILSKIFGHAEAPIPASAPAPTASRHASTAAATAKPAAPIAPAQPVDIAAVLTRLAAAKGRPSNWRESIVDLLQLLDLDSSLAARKELGDELNIQVGADGSAEQNIALHKAVMKVWCRSAMNRASPPARLPT